MCLSLSNLQAARCTSHPGLGPLTTLLLPSALDLTLEDLELRGQVSGGRWEVGCGMWDVRMWDVRMWDVGCGMWDVGCGMWDVGCGMWDVGCGRWQVRSQRWEVGRGQKGSDVRGKMQDVRASTLPEMPRARRRRLSNAGMGSCAASSYETRLNPALYLGWPPASFVPSLEPTQGDCLS